jgi:hypothetical protein
MQELGDIPRGRCGPEFISQHFFQVAPIERSPVLFESRILFLLESFTPYIIHAILEEVFGSITDGIAGHLFDVCLTIEVRLFMCREVEEPQFVILGGVIREPGEDDGILAICIWMGTRADVDALG